MSTRDYAADMRAVIDAETGGGPYVSRVIAAHIVEKLRATDSDLLSGWLDAHAEQLIWQAINDRDRSTRSHARATARRSVFAAAAKAHESGEAHESGDDVPLTHFLNVPYVVANGSRKRLADLDAADLTFVADAYDERARDNAMNAAFLRALSKKVGGGRVADQFSEDRLAELWRSITSR